MTAPPACTNSCVPLIATSQGAADKLSRTQKGQYVVLCWLTHIYKHFPDPKPSYVADWEQLPDWQKEADADIFEHISHEISQPDTGSVTYEANRSRAL